MRIGHIRKGESFLREKVKIKLLGRPEVYIDGERAKLPFKQAEALLYYLLIKGEATKFVLADIIWESKDQSEKVMSSMRNAIYVLRKLFGKDFLIEPVKNTIQINPKYSMEVDVATFSTGSDGVDFYQGALLEDFYLKDNNLYNEWVEAERQRYAELYQNRLRAGIDDAFAKGDYARCETLCKALIESDEFDESGYFGLIRLYHKNHEYLKAVTLYEKLEKLYMEELFEVPSPRTRELIEVVKAEQKRDFSEWIEKKTDTKAESKPSAFFFGRKRESAQIAGQIETFLLGERAQSVVLTGEGGVGKTFLAENVLSSFSDREDILILESVCYRGEEKYTLKPWQKILKRLIEEDRSGEHAWITDAISTVLPFMRSGRPKHKQKDDVGVVNYQNLEQSIAEMLVQMGAKRKMILFFDDVQWADESSLSLIRHIMTLGANTTVLFVMTFKEEAVSGDYTERFLENMKLTGLLDSLPLGRFSYDDTLSMTRLLLPEHAFTRDFGLQFYCETEGNPFFIVEMVNNIKDKGSLDDITPNIRDVIKNRISYLTQECQSLLELMSLFFEGVSFDVLLDLSKKGEMELADALEQLLTRHFIREDVESGEIVYRFTHQKIPEYIYKNMSQAKKRILHAKAARCFELQFDNSRDDFMLCTKLIYHFERAGERLKYLKYTVRYMHGYLGVAHEYFPVVSKGIIDDARGRALLAGNAYNAMHDRIEEVSGLLESLMQELNEDFTTWDEETFDTISESYHLIGRYHILNCDYVRGVKYIEQLKRINGQAENARQADYLVKANKQLLYIHINMGNPSDMLAVIHETFALLPMLGDAEKTAVWTRMRGMGEIMSGMLPEGEVDLLTAAEIFKNCRDRNKYLYNLAATYAWLGESKRHQRASGEADAFYKKAIDTLNNFHWVGGGATFYSYAGMNAYDSGDYETAERHLQNAFSRYDKVTQLWGRGLARAYAALLAADRKEYGEAYENLLLAQKNADKLDSFYEKGVISRVRAQLARRMERDTLLTEALRGAVEKSSKEYAREAQEYLKNVYSPVDAAYLEELLR